MYVAPSYETYGHNCPVVGVAALCPELSAVVVNEVVATDLLYRIGDMVVGFAIAEALYGLNPDPACPAAMWMSWV